MCSKGETEAGCGDLVRQRVMKGGFPEQVTFKTWMINGDEAGEEEKQEDYLQRS